MNKTLSIANLALVVIGGFFLFQSVLTWINPEYPSRVDGTSLAGAPKTAQRLEVFRKPYSPGMTSSMAQQNLFRKERNQFQSPIKVAAAPMANKTPVPPPNLQLKGVILLGGDTKIALLEGSYSIPDGNSSVKNKPLKRKGYFLGSRIGGYLLTRIEKASVFLADSSGGTLELKLADRPPEKTITRQGNALIQTSKNFNPKDLKATPPSRRVSPAPTAAPATKAQPEKPEKAKRPRFRVSGAGTPHISGR